MLNIVTRPLTPEERAVVERARGSRGEGFLVGCLLLGGLGCGPGCFLSFLCLVGLPTAGAVIAILPTLLVVWLLRLLGVPEPSLRSIVLIVFLTGPVIGFLVGLYLMVRGVAAEVSKVQEGKRAIERDLFDNQAEVLHCTVLDAVEVDPVDDEGHAYFLDLGDATLLYLQGEYLDELTDGDRFPNREVRLVRTPTAKMRLALECLGETFEPSRSIDPLEIQALFPEDGEILPGRSDTLEADLRQFEQQRRRRA